MMQYVRNKPANDVRGVFRPLTLPLLALALVSFVPEAHAKDNDPSTTTNSEQFEKLKAQRAALAEDNVYDQARLTMEMLYAAESASDRALEKTLILEMEKFIDIEFDESLKSFVFYSVFSHYSGEADFDKALSFLEVYDQGQTPENRATRRYTIEQTLATVYEALDMHDKVVEYMSKVIANPEYKSIGAYAIDKEFNNTTLARAYRRMGDNASAMKHIELAKTGSAYTGKFQEERDEPRDPYIAQLIVADIMIEQANIELVAGRLQEAEATAWKVFQTATKLEQASTEIIALDLLGRIELAKNAPETAYQYFLRAKEHAAFDESDAPVDFFASLAQSAEGAGNIPAALKHYKTHGRLNTTERKKRDVARLSFLTAQTEKIERAREMEALSSTAEAEAQKAERNRQLAMLGGVAALMALIALLAAIGTMRGQRKSREALKRYTEKLEQSEARARENEQKANLASEAKSSFLANMSHEIRTPMNGVLGMAQILRASGLNKQQQEYAETIHSSGSALLTIINDVLDFSKIEAGKLELDPTPGNLREAVEDVATMMATRADEKQIEMLVRYAPGAPENIVADIGRIRQALVNLVGNAVKFTHSGHVLINVTGQENDGRAAIKIEVLDTGIGIPEDRIEAVFEDFSQAENSTTRKFGGTGLGLAISKRLLEAMGGDLSVKSRHGHGSIFTIKLDVPMDKSVAKAQRFVPDLNEMRVLIIDDLKVNRQILSEQLRNWNVQHTAAASGHDGYRMMVAAAKAGKPFDLVLLDYHMPKMDGEQVATVIRKTPGIHDTRIIVLSSADGGGRAQRFRELDVAAYVVKPIKSSTLLDVIAETMSEHTPKTPAPAPEKVIAKMPTPAPATDTPAAILTEINILVAEDNEVNRRVVSAFLRGEEMKVTFAENGREAFETFKVKYFDMVLMDLSMPEMDGLDATKAIRAFENTNGLERTPIICLSAHVMESDKQQALSVGMDDHLAKPLLKERLDEAVNRWGFVKRKAQGRAEPVSDSTSWVA